MTARSYRAVWRERFEKSASDFQEILRDFDPFDGWQDNDMPEGSATDEFLKALEILYGHQDPRLAERFLDRAARIVTRTVREDRLSSPRCRAAWPGNRAELLRTRTYVDWLLGATLQSEVLGRAAADYEAWALRIEGRNWDSQAQAYYLNAVRLLLIAGDLENARRLLPARRSLEWHRREADLWERLVARDPLGLRQDSRFQGDLETFFHDVRDPAYSPGVFFESFVLPLEVGLIRDRYVVAFNGTADWRRVVDAVSA